MKKSIAIIGVEKTGAEIALKIVRQNLLTDTELIIASVDFDYLNDFIGERHEDYPSYTGFQILKPFEGKVTSDKIPYINSVFDDRIICVIVCAGLEEESARKYAPLIALDAMLKGKSVISVFSSPDFKCEDSRLQAKLQLTMGSHKTIEQNEDVLRTISDPKYSDPYINLIEGLKMALDTNKPIKRCTIGPKADNPLIEIRGQYFHSMTNEQRIKNFDSLANIMNNDMRFKDKVVVITGGAKGIGACSARRFRDEGAKVEIIDKTEGDWFVGDIADPNVLEQFAEHVINKHGHIDILVNNALPPMVGIDDCSWDEFLYAQKVGVAAPFYLCKLFKNHFPQSASIINISSTRDSMSQPQTESYTAAKGGIAALTHALAVSLAPKVRVNAISPGWINTSDEVYGGADASQHLVGRIGRPDDIASMVLFLCSDEAGFITGQNIVIDGGMTRQMIYHNDHGWTLEK